MAIEPAILYAATVWQEAIKRNQVKKQLLALQRKAALKITKAYRTSPTNALLVMAGMLPINIMAQVEAWKWLLTNTELWKMDPHEIDRKIKINIIPENYKEIPVIVKKNEIDKTDNSINLEIHPANKGNHQTSMEYEPEDNKHYHWLAYTDGSKQETGVGAGVYIVKNKENRTYYQASLKLDKECSNNQAELWALLRAIKHINNNLDTYKGNIKFLIDSKTAIQTLSKNKGTTLLGNETIREAINLEQNRKIQYSWIPAHKGFAGNEIADALAKKATKINSKITYKRIPKTKLKKSLTDWAINKWQVEWNDATTGRMCNKFIPNILNRIKAKHYKPNSITSQCLTGHGKFEAYFCRFHIQPNNKCSCDNNSVGDAEHFMFHCSLFDHHRFPFYRECIQQGLQWPPNPKLIFENNHIWKKFENFVTNTRALVPDNMTTQDASQYEDNQESDDTDTGTETEEEINEGDISGEEDW
ncbi:uncharacterized protein [Centruroides vittatus]|uniref:uncharacterized protein n=1 Tax=Centruroides vittatus TaxID=120091 RepID=UPI0035102DE1